MYKKIIVILFIVLIVGGLFYRQTILRLYQGWGWMQTSKERVNYYILPDGSQIQDITQKIISDETAPADLKKPLINGDRRIVIFKYPSGSEYVAGFLSYITHGVHPVIIYLRGGNGFFGIMRPNNKFSLLPGYNVVGTLYRGNMYGGKDEFGGADIQDVESLLKYFPELERFTHIKMRSPYAMMGASRGAMEMFIALSQSNYVKNRVDRAISVSGNVNLKVSMKNRPEMEYLFKTKFKNSNASSFDEWMRIRNPVDNVMNLKKSLKVLLIYGLNDNRVSMEEQQSFKKALDDRGIISKLVKIPGANHSLDDHYNDFEKAVINFMR